MYGREYVRDSQKRPIKDYGCYNERLSISKTINLKTINTLEYCVVLFNSSTTVFVIYSIALRVHKMSQIVVVSLSSFKFYWYTWPIWASALIRLFIYIVYCLVYKTRALSTGVDTR